MLSREGSDEQGERDYAASRRIWEAVTPIDREALLGLANDDRVWNFESDCSLAEWIQGIICNLIDDATIEPDYRADRESRREAQESPQSAT